MRKNQAEEPMCLVCFGTPCECQEEYPEVEGTILEDVWDGPLDMEDQ